MLIFTTMKIAEPIPDGLKDIPCHRLATKESQKCKSCVYLMVTILFKATQGHRFSPTIEKSELFLNQIIIPKTAMYQAIFGFLDNLWSFFEEKVVNKPKHIF